MSKSANRIHEIILDLVNWRCNHLPDQLTDNGELIGGAYPGGVNGPYKDEETNFRNSAHWIIIFIAAWKISGDQQYKHMAENELKYLLDNSPGSNKPYCCRVSKTRDATNGIIGQAWIMEGLIYAWRYLENNNALQEAERLYRIHEFDSEVSAWHTQDLNGNVNKIDGTFNHQLWFAYVSALLPNDQKRSQHIDEFMRVNGIKVRTVLGGVILHNMILGRNGWIKLFFSYPIRAIKRFIKSITLIGKSIAYHPFNLYAYAGLYNAGLYHDYFQSEKFLKKIKVCNRKGFNRVFYSSKYGSKYNPVGFELAYVQSIFPGKIKKNTEELIDKQFRSAPLFQGLNNKDGKDVDYVTLHSRGYELAKVVLDIG